MKTFRLFLLFCFPFALLQGVDTSALKERFAERLPVIEQLWKEGQVGENNQGYLSVRSKLTPEAEKLVKAENADRKLAYELIAARSDVPAAKVGQQRALQIAEQAADGLWLQDPQGEWYRKDN